MMGLTATLKIKNCLDCPHHKERSDPGSVDSFDAGDTTIYCSKKNRDISVSERPWRHRKYCKVPAWCPLVK